MVDFSKLRTKFGESSSSADPSRDPTRVLIYGPAKSRKTWWAGTAGETHNVYLLNGDRNTGILNQLPENVHNNVHIIPIALNPNPTSTSFLLFLTLLFEKQEFIFDYESGNEISFNKVKEDKDYLCVDLSKLSRKDVLFIDSWTAVVKDVASEYQQANGINPFEGKLTNDKNKFSYFGYANLVLDNILSCINKLPCHVIMSGHQDDYEREVKEGAVTKKALITQVLSSSGNHASKLPAVLSDVLWFRHNKDATKTIIDSRPANNRAGGAAKLRPDTFEFPSWTWKEYCREASVPVEGNHLDEKEMPAICLLSGKDIKFQ